MTTGVRRRLLVSICLAFVPLASTVRAEGNLHRVKHIIVVMQENHSFDNYFGVLPYVSGTPYHAGPCASNDHACVDGLSCSFDSGNNLVCTNSNLDDDGTMVASFHDQNYCPGPDLQHNWQGSHREANYSDPANALAVTLNDGFVLENDATEQLDNGVESATEDDTMGFYDDGDLPFYYSLARTFAIDDRYFCSVLGQTFPNRSYAMAATSFGHVTTAEIFPPAGGYKPITGTIFDLLDQNGVSWKNYFSDLPVSGIFRPSASPHLSPIAGFMADAAKPDGLPAVSFVDPSFFPDQPIDGGVFETDEHPPFDIRAGEFFVSGIVNAVRNGPNWKDSIIFITYDEHGGFYDHVAPPQARQGQALNPDGINPGQCEDLSNPPTSTMPGGGAQCSVSQSDVASICPDFSPTGPYPADCANFNQYGFRVPFIAVSPFSKPHYVSHTVGDHTAILALIEKRFFSLSGAASERPHLTARDLHAHTLEDMFDFNHSPSLDAAVPTAPAPVVGEHGCPFVP